MLRRQLSLLAISAVLSAALCEVILRIVVGPAIVFRIPQEQYISDPDLIYTLRPGQEAFTHDKPVSINSLGLRDRSYPKRKDSNVTRILALGDSQTFGNGLNLADTWPKQLESLLDTDGQMRWEVVNGGLPASDTRQQSLRLGRILESMDVDLILVALYVNDVSPSSDTPPFPVDAKLSAATRVAYVLKRSALFTAFWQARAPLLRLFGEPSTTDRLELAVLRGEPSRLVEQGWDQVENSLAEIKAQAADRGLKAIVVVLPRRDQISGVLIQTAYNDRARKIAQRQGLESIDVLSDLRDAYRIHSSRLFIAWDGHHSALANTRIAETIHPRIRRWSRDRLLNRVPAPAAPRKAD